MAGGTLTLGGDLTVDRMGFGAMRLTGKGIWGEPRDRGTSIAVLERASILEENVAAADIELTLDELAALELVSQ